MRSLAADIVFLVAPLSPKPCWGISAPRPAVLTLLPNPGYSLCAYFTYFRLQHVDVSRNYQKSI